MAEVERTAELQELLRTCVQCGLCLPHCATWLGTGNEAHSPRGRLVLLEDWLSGGARDPESEAGFLAAWDQCIGCRACETACPSGVPFDLLEYGQRLAQNSGQSAAGVLPGVLADRLDRRSYLRPLGSVSRMAVRLLKKAFGEHWRKRLGCGAAPIARWARLLGTLPRSPGRDAVLLDLIARLESQSAQDPGLSPLPAMPPVESMSPPAIAFFRGCANDALLPDTSRRIIQLLHAAGCEVRFPEPQDCCGAWASHRGRPERATQLQETNRRAFGDLRSGELVLVEAAGCGLEWKQTQPQWADRVIDSVVLVSKIPLPDLGRIQLKVVVHDPCHARHGQGIQVEPRQVLDRIPGIKRLEADEADVCCGSGGNWSLRYPELSQSLGRRKAAILAATGADLVVTSNPGCLGQIADGLALEAPELPILPLTDLLWVAYRRGMANPAQYE